MSTNRIALSASPARRFIVAYALSSFTTACGPGPLPPQDESRVVMPAPSASPEACVKAFWARKDSDDILGASAYVSEARRVTFTASTRSTAATNRARSQLHDAMEMKFGVGAGRAVEVTPPLEREAAASLKIQQVKLGDHEAWVHAVSGGGHFGGVVSGIQAFHLVFENGGWFVDDDQLGLTGLGVKAEEQDQIRIDQRSREEIEPLTRDVLAGKITRDDAQRRYAAIEQRASDRDAVAGHFIEYLAMGDCSFMPIEASLRSGCATLSTHWRDYILTRDSVKSDLSTHRWTRASESFAAAIPGAMFPFPHGKATVGSMDPGHEEVTIEWFDASGGPSIARTTYPLKQIRGGDWVFVPAADDWVSLTCVRRF